MIRLQPQANDAEIAVLGAVMLEKNAFEKIADILTPDSFYVTAHQKIFAAFCNLNKKHQPIDIITVTDQLKNNGELETIGGAYQIVKITNDVVSTANLINHARIVAEKYLLRRIISFSANLANKAFSTDSDPFELIDEAEKNILSISNIKQSDMSHISSVMLQTLKKIDKWRLSKSAVTGIKSGFSELDYATRGWQPGDLVIIAARPSVGKTAFALNLVRNAALNGSGVAVWSLEMKAPYLALRMLAAESDIFLNKLQTGRLTDEDYIKINEAANKLSEKKVFFDDNASVTIRSVKAKARRLKKTHDIGMIVIDYLQLMQGDAKNNREQEIATISRELKNLAQELEIPVIALSQLSRDGTKQTGWDIPPPLSSLRESGAIEQDADVVCMLWGANDAEKLQDMSFEYKRRLKIVKQRNGMLMTVDLDFKNEIQLFKSYSEDNNLF